MAEAVLERIFVTWTQEWDLHTYIAHYVRTRRLPVTPAEHDRVTACLASYPGRRPLTKSDLDFYLDANLHRATRRG